MAAGRAHVPRAAQPPVGRLCAPLREIQGADWSVLRRPATFVRLPCSPSPQAGGNQPTFWACQPNASELDPSPNAGPPLAGNLPNFWAYQWERHGACAAPLLDALAAEAANDTAAADDAAAEPLPAYFNVALRLHEAWDINVRRKGLLSAGVGRWDEGGRGLAGWARPRQYAPPAAHPPRRAQEALVRQGFNPLSATSATAVQVSRG